MIPLAEVTRRIEAATDLRRCIGITRLTESCLACTRAVCDSKSASCLARQVKNEYSRRSRIRHRAKRNAYCRQWRADNREAFNAHMREYQREKRALLKALEAA